ncbi:MAG: PIN domain-containing protein [Spirochaetaceae bacterium]|nr:MAG: PIN domain-containing protein [Spirochaetaceae bacterium]
MKQALLDSSVVLDLLTRDPAFFAPSKELLVRWGCTHALCINAVVYSEISVGFRTIESLEATLAGLEFLVLPIPRAALFLAGKAFVAYRKRGGSRESPLPDFFIGAHAAVERLTLLTRDPARIHREFPTVEIVQPGPTA